MLFSLLEIKLLQLKYGKGGKDKAVLI